MAQTNVTKETGKYTLKQAMYIIDNIRKAHEEDGFNEMVPAWHDAMLKCLETLSESEQSKTVEEYSFLIQ